MPQCLLQIGHHQVGHFDGLRNLRTETNTGNDRPKDGSQARTDMKMLVTYEVRGQVNVGYVGRRCAGNRSVGREVWKWVLIRVALHRCWMVKKGTVWLAVHHAMHW
jgi:hypothetical protein